MSQPGTTLSTQRTKYNELAWKRQAHHSSHIPKTLNMPALNTDFPVTPPLLEVSGMQGSHGFIPFWQYKYQINSREGLVISDINVRNSQELFSTEQVLTKIQFTDLFIYFEDNTKVEYDIAKVLNGSSGYCDFFVGEAGKVGSDTLYQSGLKLLLDSHVLAPPHRCRVVLEMSVVFRGAANDIDPGSVPVGMKLWPQLSFKWVADESTKKVVKFSGSVKMSMINKMHSSHNHNGTPPNANVASMFTDSNTAMSEDPPVISIVHPSRRQYYPSHPLAGLVALINQPLGWGVLFDYTKLDIQTETEITAVYAPEDGNKYFGFTAREQRYEWLPSPFSPGIVVKKAPRQGMYDNIHLHAKMPNKDDKGNVQIHAPFCGHSCVHVHWRWSNISSTGLFGDDRFKGWSGQKAYAVVDAPQVPPNQRVKIALCNHNANPGTGGKSYSDASILNPSSNLPLDALKKMLWYRSEIFLPKSGESQVILEHGIGWAFRYSYPFESFAVNMLTKVLPDDLPHHILIIPTVHQMNQFFEESVYPSFRYKGNNDQVPPGTHTKLFDGRQGPAMEDL